MTTKRPVFLYLRVSDPSKGDRVDPLASIPRQRAELRALAERNGDVVLEVFEEAQTAHEGGRPEYERMMARLHEVGAVYVVAYDRLTRIPDPAENETIRKIFVAARTDIVTPAHAFRYSDPTFDTPETRLHQRTLGMFGAFEWDSIVRRLRKGKISKVKSGQYYGHPVPYGYRVSFDATTGAKLFTPDEDQARVINLVFQLYREGNGGSIIARELNMLGVPTVTGARWSEVTVRNMLSQHLYVGRSSFGMFRHGKRADRGGLDPMVDAPVVVESTAFPAIVPVETWDAVQEQRSKRVRKAARRGVSEHLLSGILRCPGCGGRMHSHGTWSKAADHYYTCRQVASDYKAGFHGAEQACPQRTWYNMRTAQEALHKWLLVHLERYASGAHRRKRGAAKPRATEMVAAARRRVAELEQQWAGACRMAELGVYKPDEAARRLDGLREELTQAGSHLEGLERTATTHDTGSVDVTRMLGLLAMMDPNAPELRNTYVSMLSAVHLKKLPKKGRTIPLAVERVRFINGEWYPGPPPQG